MAAFTVRVEPHGANAKEYEALHAARERHGYRREIEGSKGRYRLPTAEYNLEGGSMTATEVCEQACSIARTVKSKPDPWVFVTEAKTRSWSTEKISS